MAAHHAVGDEITLPDGTTGVVRHVFTSQKWRGDLIVQTAAGKRLVLASEWES